MFRADGPADIVGRRGGVTPIREDSYCGRVRFEVLGRLRVLDGRDSVSDDAAELRLGGSRQQLVLAMLLAQPNSVVLTDALVDGLWGDSPPSAARHTVQGYVSELRKLLGPIIEREGGGYVVRVDRSSLDSLEFESCVRRGRAELASDPEQAAATLRIGLQMWRSTPFAGLSDSGVLGAERSRLEELRLLAVEDRVEAELASGRHREMASELDALIREHPYREGLHAQHMLALYRSGRQADALRAFQRTRRMLVDELGIEPSPLLRHLEEQILVQDSALDLPSAVVDPSGGDPTRHVDNPYKGLRPFAEGDADNFFGRDELLGQLVDIVTGDARLTAVVGPSGSGKSSLVHAGLIPALRRARPSPKWLIAPMRPGADPFTEIEAALARAVDEAPAVSATIQWDHDSDLLRAVSRILRDDDSRLLLVIDQFEELFALADDERDRFLRSVIALATDARNRSRVVVTLRADFYDRPLMHPTLGRMMTGHVVNVTPLEPDELEAAALGPAHGVGVTFERGLLAGLIAEVSGQPHALPLFQFTLTELFERRQDSVMTREVYDALGGIRAAVASRAEELYQGLDLEQQEAVRQLFLRLVTVGNSESRRVVSAAELITLDVDIVAMHAAIDAFVASRLLVRDRDAVSGALTIEVAHEALLSVWERLRVWIEVGRGDLRQHLAYRLAVDEWLTAGRDPDYLLTGGRLDHFEQWRVKTLMRLTAAEREFLDEAVRVRADFRLAETRRGAEQARLGRRGRRRGFALGAAVTALMTAAVIVIVAAVGSSHPPRIAIVAAGDPAGNQAGDGYEQGFVRAERDFDLDADRRDLLLSSAILLDDLSAIGTDLVILDPHSSTTIEPGLLDPDTRYVVTHDDGTAFDGLPNVTSNQWADEQAGFLAGVAAAGNTETGTIGFLGGAPTVTQESFRAGFEAGARYIDRDVRIVAAYLQNFGYEDAPLDSPDGARHVAGLLYNAGADVIFHTAGRSGVGVLRAASELTATHLWVIGVEHDEWQTASTRDRPHILTSIVKRFDMEIYTTIEDYLNGRLDPGARRLTVADDLITYTTSGHALSPADRATLNRVIDKLASGQLQPPLTPNGVVSDQGSLLETNRVTGVFAGVQDGPVTIDRRAAAL